MLRSVKPLRIFRMLKTLKAVAAINIGSIYGSSTAIMLAQTFRIPSFVLRVGQVLLVLTLLVHTSACMFWLVKTDSTPAADVDDWMIRNGLSSYERASLSEKYVAAVYFVFTIFTTVGFGDMVPETTEERGNIPMPLHVAYFALLERGVVSCLHLRLNTSFHVDCFARTPSCHFASIVFLCWRECQPCSFVLTSSDVPPFCAVYIILLFYISMLGFGALLAEVQDAMMQRGRFTRIRSGRISGMIDFLREKECPQDVRSSPSFPHFSSATVFLSCVTDFMRATVALSCLVSQIRSRSLSASNACQTRCCFPLHLSLFCPCICFSSFSMNICSLPDFFLSCWSQMEAKIVSWMNFDLECHQTIDSRLEILSELPPNLSRDLQRHLHRWITPMFPTSLETFAGPFLWQDLFFREFFS